MNAWKENLQIEISDEGLEALKTEDVIFFCVCVYKLIHTSKQMSVCGWIYVLHILPFLPSCECDMMLKIQYQHCGMKNKTSLRLLQSLRRMPQPRFCSGAPEMFCGPQNVTRLSISPRASRERLNLSVSVNLSLKAHVSTQGWAVAD